MRKIVILIIGVSVIGAALACGGVGGDPVASFANCAWEQQGDHLKNNEGFRSASEYRAFLQQELDAGNIDMDEIQRWLELCLASR